MNRIERKQNIGLLTFKEAVKHYRVSKQTLLKALANGEVPALKIGRQWRVYPFQMINVKIQTPHAQNSTLEE